MIRGLRQALRGCAARVIATLVLADAFAPGCAEAPAAPAASSLAPDGDPNAAPSLAVLPELPLVADTPSTHQGLLAARETLDAALPAAPADRAYASLLHWVDTEVVAWIGERRLQTAVTRDRFVLEGAPNDAERIVSHAVIALIAEDTARQLGNMPAPSELDSEPEISAMYRDVVRTQARGFFSQAIVELRECANAAYRGPRSLRGFAHFCHARFDRLQREQASDREAQPALAASKPN